MNTLRQLARIAAFFGVALMASSLGWAQQASDVIAPEAKTGTQAAQAVQATKQMVVAANPIAAQAGLDMLRAGGNAADALVAVQTVLGLVEPQSSGLGGGPSSSGTMARPAK